jgi:hypothetical protein
MEQHDRLHVGAGKFGRATIPIPALRQRRRVPDRPASRKTPSLFAWQAEAHGVGSSSPSRPKPTTRLQALKERAAPEIPLPCVEGYSVALPDEQVQAVLPPTHAWN